MHRMTNPESDEIASRNDPKLLSQTRVAVPITSKRIDRLDYVSMWFNALPSTLFIGFFSHFFLFDLNFQSKSCLALPKQIAMTTVFDLRYSLFVVEVDSMRFSCFERLSSPFAFVHWFFSHSFVGSVVFISSFTATCDAFLTTHARGHKLTQTIPMFNQFSEERRKTTAEKKYVH